jgi:hypothetical protein
VKICKRKNQPAPPTKAEGKKLGEELQEALGDVGQEPPETRAQDIIDRAKGKKKS